jgi:hypothetical protein
VRIRNQSYQRFRVLNKKLNCPGAIQSAMGSTSCANRLDRATAGRVRLPPNPSGLYMARVGGSPGRVHLGGRLALPCIPSHVALSSLSRFKLHPNCSLLFIGKPYRVPNCQGVVLSMRSVAGIATPFRWLFMHTGRDKK